LGEVSTGVEMLDPAQPHVVATSAGPPGELNLNPYDVVVLDRDIPGIHGEALCQMIAASERPAMVLMLTAADTPANGSLA
jgi:DNA-binding response OmpR family regulator